MVLSEEIEQLKLLQEEVEKKVNIYNERIESELVNTETAHVIEEIIEGISLQGRRGTLVRTISAVLR